MEKVKLSELELGDEFYYGVDKEKYKLVTKALQLFSDNEEITYIAQRSKDRCILDTENLDVYINYKSDVEKAAERMIEAFKLIK